MLTLDILVEVLDTYTKFDVLDTYGSGLIC